MAYTDPINDFYYIPSSTEEPEGIYELNRDLNLAHRIIEETGANLFLTGKAGTGKTTFLRRLRQTSPKRMIVLAPTGVAAINAEGSTIHSFFQIPFSPFIPGKGFLEKDSRRFQFRKEKRRIIAALDLLVIDEISMVRPDTLDAIDSVLRRYRNPLLPFGGVQLLLIGDLRQLAPVLREDERQILAPYYPSEYFFESRALKESGFLTIELSTVYRQTDREFINILNAVRDGRIDHSLLERLNSRFNPGFIPRPEERYIRLTSHNRMADSINQARLAEIPEEGTTYIADIKDNFPESSYPAEYNLYLKPGAQVMFIKNDSGTDRQYYNGMLGEVTGLTEDSVIVRPVDGRPPITVGKVTWENTRYEIDEQKKEVIQVIDGTFSQMPLRLAWAITIHKSQGLTFDHAIIDAGYSFAPGQTYVALSRCRSLDGLVLGQKIPPSAVITDYNVNSFIAESERNRPDERSVDAMRAEYNRTTLADIFDFRGVKAAFDDYHRAVSEYIIPEYSEYYAPFKEAAEILTKDVEHVGLKFISLYASAPIAPEHFAAHPEVLEKVKNGCAYFSKLIKRVIEVVKSVTVKLANKAHVQRMDNAYQSALFALSVKYIILRNMASTEFSPTEYITAKAKAVFDASAMKK